MVVCSLAIAVKTFSVVYWAIRGYPPDGLGILPGSMAIMVLPFFFLGPFEYVPLCLVKVMKGRI
jgi:hypothetical protein